MEGDGVSNGKVESPIGSASRSRRGWHGGGIATSRGREKNLRTGLMD